LVRCYYTGNMGVLVKNLSLYYIAHVPEMMTPDTPAILMLHGIGGNEYQLFNFVDNLPQDHLIVAIRAPFTIHNGSYTWFSVDFSVPAIDHIEAEKSRLFLKSFINEIAELYKIKREKISVLGFSQGAIMSFSVGLTEPTLFGKLIALSGRILPETMLQSSKIKMKNQNMRVFVGHGIYDPTLPVKWAREAKHHIESLSLPLTYHEYNIWHEVSDQEMNDILQFIRN
jgi:phospholipase/carboxylesterase